MGRNAPSALQKREKEGAPEEEREREDQKDGHDRHPAEPHVFNTLRPPSPECPSAPAPQCAARGQRTDLVVAARAEEVKWCCQGATGQGCECMQARRIPHAACALRPSETISPCSPRGSQRRPGLCGVSHALRSDGGGQWRRVRGNVEAEEKRCVSGACHCETCAVDKGTTPAALALCFISHLSPCAAADRCRFTALGLSYGLELDVAPNAAHRSHKDGPPPPETSAPLSLLAAALQGRAASAMLSRQQVARNGNRV